MEDELWSSRMVLIESHGLDPKLAGQIARHLDIEQAQEICSLTPEQMESRLAHSLVEIERAKAEVQANEAYQKAKQDVKYFEDALKDKVNPLKAVSSLCLALLGSDAGSCKG